jgi:hypothetical protein
MEPIFKCPVCRGRIALWAVRSEFTCHHCNLILRSNRTDALTKAFWVAVAIEVLLLLFLLFVLGASFSTVVAWGSAGCVFGYFGGVLALKYFMVFQPSRRNFNTGAISG